MESAFCTVSEDDSIFLIASYTYLSKYMYANFLPANSPFSASQILYAAKLMYYWGDFAELILLVGLFFLWYEKGGFRSSAQVLAITKEWTGW